MKAFVDLVETLGIAGIAEDPQFLVDRFELLAIRRRHPFRSEPRANRFQLRHRLEHAGQPLDRRLRHHSAAMGAGFHQTTGDQPRSRRQHAAHDLVGELQPQFLRARDLVPLRRRAIDAANHRLGLRVGLRIAGRKVVEAHVSVQILYGAGSSMMLTCAATILQPSGKRTQVCICRPTFLPLHASR